MKPSIGQTVHYVSYGTPGGEYIPQCRAAIVTEVTPVQGDDAAQADIENWDEDQRYRVSLAVLNPTGLFFVVRLWRDDAAKRSGTWHWPEAPVGSSSSDGCPHCPDGHTPAAVGSQPWHVRVGPEPDGDGQPIRLYVERSAGAHVAESDAEWVRTRLNGA